MSIKSERVKSGWLLSFGDMITLLITFFILMLVLSKGEISKVQKWLEDDLDVISVQLEHQMNNAEYIKVERTALGIEINIHNDNAFVKGGFEPSDGLKQELIRVSKALKKVSLLAARNGQVLPSGIAYDVKKQGLELHREISVAGYTDNGKINPESQLRNNWFLSTMRADSVMQVMHDATGFSNDLFGIAGYGKYRPVVSNDTAEGRAENRRIKIVITANFAQKTGG